MNSHREPITNATITLQFPDGSTETWDIANGHGGRIATGASDSPAPVSAVDALRVVIESSSAGTFVTRTVARARAAGSVGGTTTSSEEQA